MNEHSYIYDKIHIRDLALRCIIGINAEERTAKQDVLINVTLHCDLRDACKSDSMRDSINYKVVKREIINLVEDSNFFLIERLAERIAHVCLRHHRVKEVDVTVDKLAETPDAAISTIKVKTNVRNYIWSKIEHEGKTWRALNPE